jgi:hypothetical protein
MLVLRNNLRNRRVHHQPKRGEDTETATGGKRGDTGAEVGAGRGGRIADTETAATTKKNETGASREEIAVGVTKVVSVAEGTGVVSLVGDIGHGLESIAGGAIARVTVVRDDGFSAGRTWHLRDQ